MNHSDPFDLQAQEIANTDASDKAKRALLLEVDDLKWVMSDKRGRRFVAGIIKRSCLDSSIFNTNAMTMAHLSGRQVEGGYQRLNIESHCPNRYAEMLKESKE